MRLTVLLSMCFAVLCGSVARADLKEGTYAPDIEAQEWMNTAQIHESETDDPISLAELRGMVVVLYFWVSWHQGGESLMPLINIIENHPNLGRRRGVFIMGVTDADRSRVETMVKEEHLFFPIALESDAHEDYDINSFPRVVVIDPEGKIAYSGWPGREGGSTFVNKVLEVVADSPPTRTHPREAAEARRYLDRAREAIRAGEYRTAFHEARTAYEMTLVGDKLKTTCQEMLDLLEAIGRDKLAQGMAALDRKEFDEGVTLLREVNRLFRGLNIAKTAKRRLKALEKQYAGVADVLKSLDREAEARGLLVAAEQALRSQPPRIGEAYELLGEIVKDYEDSEASEGARTIMGRIEKNPTMMGYVRDHQAADSSRNWLAQARSYIRMGNLAKARELARRVIEQYPDTVYAEQAYDLLRQLP